MSLETVATDYAPLNTPIDGDRDYSDLTGMYQGGVLPQGMLGDCNCRPRQLLPYRRRA
jgi:hypothetical protein